MILKGGTLMMIGTTEALRRVYRPPQSRWCEGRARGWASSSHDLPPPAHLGAPTDGGGDSGCDGDVRELCVAPPCPALAGEGKGRRRHPHQQGLPLLPRLDRTSGLVVPCAHLTMPTRELREGGTLMLIGTTKGPNLASCSVGRWIPSSPSSFGSDFGPFRGRG